MPKTNTPKVVQRSTYFLSLAVAILLTAGITAVTTWFFSINTVNDFRGSLIEDLKATTAVINPKANQ